jgi:ubiquinone/menaquinone biosynthesis C-methylase UbiE
MRSILPSFLAFFFAAAFPGAIIAGDAPKPPPGLYETRADHDPNGIGVFYMGREIAHVMGHQAADWLERIDRDEEEGTDHMVDALNFHEGEVVADIGCGTGYVSRKISKKVGVSGHIYGVDIQQEMLDLLAKRMAMFRITNVQPVRGTITDPKVPPASCDTMIMVDVYHEFDHPYEMIESMIAGLKPGGRIVFVEYRGEDPEVPIKLVHKMTEAQVKKEMTVHPELSFSESLEVLPRQHIIIFKKE